MVLGEISIWVVGQTPNLLVHVMFDWVHVIIASGGACQQFKRNALLATHTRNVHSPSFSLHFHFTLLCCDWSSSCAVGSQ